MIRIEGIGRFGYVVIDTSERYCAAPLFASHDTALVFAAFIQSFDELPDELLLAAAIERFLAGLSEVDLGVFTTPDERLAAFVASPEFAALGRRAA